MFCRKLPPFACRQCPILTPYPGQRVLTYPMACGCLVVASFVCVHAESLQSIPALWDPVDCTQPGYPAHGILQARILVWVATPSSRDHPDPGIEPVFLMSPSLTGGFFTTSTTWETCGWLSDAQCLNWFQSYCFENKWVWDLFCEKIPRKINDVQFSCSVVSDSLTPWTAACQPSQSNTNSQSLLRLMSIKSVMPSNYIILCHPLLLLPSIFPSIRVFSNESVLHIRWPKYWSFSFIISPSNEYSEIIFFRIDWLDLLPVKGILNSLIQHHSSEASILQCSAFFIVQLSQHDYWKNRTFD